MTTESGRCLSESALYTGRGTTALWAVLSTLREAGPFVLLPVNICEIVVPAIRHAGFIPVFHDVDPVNGNATIDYIRRAHQPGMAVCVVVHNFGSPLDMDSICSWAREAGVFLIEDACNALGATWKGRPVGSFGDAALTSFGHGKIVDAGGGGALHVRNEERREKARLLIDSLPVFSSLYKQADAQYQAVVRALRKNPLAASPAIYRAVYSSYSRHLLYKPDDGLLRAISQGLLGLPGNLDARREKADIWRRGLAHPRLQHREHLEGDVYWRYTFLVPEDVRDHLLETLRSHGVPASKWFPPIHALFDGRRTSGSYPGAESFASRCLNVFVDHSIEKSDIEAATTLIQQALGAS